MHRRLILALIGATVALLASSVPALAAGGTTVSVRVEGLKRTLLPATSVHTHTGSITKGGTPHGKCSDLSAAGALDLATDHHWYGTWEKSYDTLLLTSIFGETHTLKSPYYWSIWVNDSYAQSGICGLKLHRGEQLLFAAVPDAIDEFPLGLSAPRTVREGHPFKVKVVWFNDGGKAAALAGAHVDGAVTNKHGIATITARHTGFLTLRAVKKDYIRGPAARVHVIA